MSCLLSAAVSTSWFLYFRLPARPEIPVKHVAPLHKSVGPFGGSRQSKHMSAHFDGWKPSFVVRKSPIPSQVDQNPILARRTSIKTNVCHPQVFWTWISCCPLLLQGLSLQSAINRSLTRLAPVYTPSSQVWAPFWICMKTRLGLLKTSTCAWFDMT